MAGSTTTTTTKKRTSRAKKISIEEAEAEKQKAIQKALDKQKEELENDFEDRLANDDGEEEDFNFGSTTHEAYYEDPEEPGEPNVDIWQYGEKLESQGRSVEYQVWRNNEFVGELSTATKWSDLRSKFNGGGKYKVKIIDANTKAYIKSQTMRLADLPSSPQSERIIPPQPSMPQIDLNDTFNGFKDIFLQMQQMTNQSKTREEREEKRSMESNNTLLMNLMTTQATAQQTMLMKLAEMSQKTAETQSANFSRMLEKMDEKNTRMFEKLSDSSNKKEEFGLKEMLSLIESSRNNGMDTMKTVLELSETLSEMRGGGGEISEPVNKESAITKLITGFLPLLTKANQAASLPGVAPQQHPMQRRMVQQAPLPPQAPAPRPAPNPQRAAAPQTRTYPQGQGPIKGPGVYSEKIPQAPKAGSLGFATLADKKITTPTPQRSHAIAGQLSPTATEISVAVGESSEEFIKKTLEEVNSITTPKNIKERMMSEESSEFAKAFEPIMGIVRESEIYKKANHTQQTIVELALPVVAQFMNDNTYKPEIVAHFVIDECSAQGFTPKVLAKEFTFDFMTSIAANFGVGEDKKVWFGEFYEAIKDASSSDGESEEEPALS